MRRAIDPLLGADLLYILRARATLTTWTVAGATLPGATLPRRIASDRLDRIEI